MREANGRNIWRRAAIARLRCCVLLPVTVAMLWVPIFAVPSNWAPSNWAPSNWAPAVWAPAVWAARPRVAKDYGYSQVKLINDHIQRGWADYAVKPSPLATDSEWCRRVFLDILGRIPSVEEVREYRANRNSNKKRELVDRLLYDERYINEYARNWTTTWTNILIGRSGGTERNSFISRAGMQKYLRDSMARNKPYDRMVYQLVTATGTTTPGTENFNGATNFLVMKVNEDKGTQAAAMTAKIFLGMQVQCTQCHNHPFNDWKQRKFWELNAFLRQTKAIRPRRRAQGPSEPARLVDRDFKGEGTTPREAEIYYELRNGEMEVAYPVFVDGTAIDRSGVVQDTVRRQELGKLIVNSKMLEKTMVNRMWGHMLGYGFTKPIDDLGPHNPPSHPALLDALAAEFRKSSFDVKQLLRWIALSQPYALSSRTNKSNEELDDPTLGEPPKFSHFYIRQMQAEQLYESLLVATAADKARGDYAAQEQAKSQWLRQFTIAFGTDEGGETTTFNGTIPQALMMFNGDFIRKAVALEPGNLLRGVADSDRKPADKINYLFDAGLARPASRDEIAVANQLLVARKGNMAEAMQDLWWAILNSNEFIMNH